MIFPSQKCTVMCWYLCGLLAAASTGNPSTYFSARQQWLQLENADRFDASASQLTPAEERVNSAMNDLKQDLRNQSTFLPAIPFHTAKASIADTALFSLIGSMPKGAILHMHWDSALPATWFVQNASYRENCYMYLSNASQTGPENLFGRSQAVQSPVNGTLRFFLKDTQPPGYVLLSELRKVHGNDTIDQQILVMITTNPTTFFPGASAEMWINFQNYFSRVWGLLYYLPVFRDYYETLFEVLATEDHVQYVEMRGLAGAEVYDFVATGPNSSGDNSDHDLEQRDYTEEEALMILKGISDATAKKYPCKGNTNADGLCFLGSTIIYAPFRGGAYIGARMFYISTTL
jgi:hypothetical protein